jgi:hypothetical protein
MNPVAAPALLAWRTIGPWTYALGAFGTIRSLGGLAPWIVFVRQQRVGAYGSLVAARIALETAAVAAGHDVRP